MKEEKKTPVKLLDTDSFKADMEKVEKYCTDINKTLFKLSKKETIYLEDLEDCIEKIDKIRRYALHKRQGDDVQAGVQFLFD